MIHLALFLEYRPENDEHDLERNNLQCLADHLKFLNRMNKTEFS